MSFRFLERRLLEWSIKQACHSWFSLAVKTCGFHLETARVRIFCILLHKTWDISKYIWIYIMFMQLMINYSTLQMFYHHHFDIKLQWDWLVELVFFYKYVYIFIFCKVVARVSILFNEGNKTYLMPAAYLNVFTASLT